MTCGKLVAPGTRPEKCVPGPTSGGRCLEPVPEALLFSFPVSALRSSALSLRYALGSDEGISQRFADPVINSFPGGTARWVDGVSRWSQLLGFRARSIFIARSGLLTEASGRVLLLCLY
ncbi:hypothetical protein Bca4012_041470 [Brassica carinata]